jgi:hypothetical protein
MIWVTWRQHRMQAAYLLLALMVTAAALVPLGRSMHGAFDHDGLAACLRNYGNPEYITPQTGNNGCGELADQFTTRFGGLLPLGILLVLLPMLVGMFLGAPLIAREVEHGTHRFAWTQGVSRLRWATTKIVLISLTGIVAAAAYALLLTWWIEPLNKAGGSRLNWLVFDLQGVVPLAYTLFAVALGIAAGTLTRKVLPAMGITLGVYLISRVLIGWLARPHYLPQVQRRIPVVTALLPNDLHGDWVIKTGVYDATGRQLLANGGRFCPPEAIGQGGAGPGDCDPTQLNIEFIQPASRFWTFQWIEAGLFTVLALGLVAFAIYRVRRSLA